MNIEMWWLPYVSNGEPLSLLLYLRQLKLISDLRRSRALTEGNRGQLPRGATRPPQMRVPVCARGTTMLQEEMQTEGLIERVTERKSEMDKGVMGAASSCWPAHASVTHHSGNHNEVCSPTECVFRVCVCVSTGVFECFLIKYKVSSRNTTNVILICTSLLL